MLRMTLEPEGQSSFVLRVSLPSSTAPITWSVVREQKDFEALRGTLCDILPESESASWGASPTAAQLEGWLNTICECEDVKSSSLFRTFVAMDSSSHKLEAAGATLCEDARRTMPQAEAQKLVAAHDAPHSPQ